MGIRDSLYSLWREAADHCSDCRRVVRQCVVGCSQRVFCRDCRDCDLRYHAEEDADVCGRSSALRHGAAGVPLAHRGECPAFYVGTRLVLYQESGYCDPIGDDLCMVYF